MSEEKEMVKTNKIISLFLSLLMLFGVIGATGISAYAAQNPKSVSLSTSTYTYDGKAKKPKVVAKDKRARKFRQNITQLNIRRAEKMSALIL